MNVNAANPVRSGRVGNYLITDVQMLNINQVMDHSIIITLSAAPVCRYDKS